MKRITSIGNVRVIHNGQHFEMPASRPVCHGYARLCECRECLARLAKQHRSRVALPWEEDYRAA